MGKYVIVKGVLIYKESRHNRTYRKKDTKFIEKKKMTEMRNVMAVIIISIIAGYFAKTNEQYIEAQGVKSADVTVEDVAPKEIEGAEVGEVTITAEAPAVDYSGIPYMVKESKVMEISAYSELDSCHYPTKDGCLTASGKVAEVGMVATNLYPFGTKLRINGQIYTVEDRISKRFNDRVDIYQGYGQRAHDQAIEFGIQHLEVEIIN